MPRTRVRWRRRRDARRAPPRPNSPPRVPRSKRTRRYARCANGSAPACNPTALNPRAEPRGDVMKGDIGDLMRQAQQMQANLQKAQAEPAQLQVTGESGGGMGKVAMDG